MKASQMPNEQYSQVGVEIGQGKYHEEMVYGLALIYTAMFDQIASYLKPHKLTPSEMNVLMLIKHQGGENGLSQVAMGQRLMVTAHNMTRLVQRLEKEGLIKRSSNKKDGRVNLVLVTPKGSKLLDQVWQGYDKQVRQLAGRLSVNDQKVFSQLILKWLGGESNG